LNCFSSARVFLLLLISSPMALSSQPTPTLKLSTLKSADAQERLSRLCELLVHGYGRTQSPETLPTTILDMCFAFYFNNERQTWKANSWCQICDKTGTKILSRNQWKVCEIKAIKTDDNGIEELTCEYQEGCYNGHCRRTKKLPRYSADLKPLMNGSERYEKDFHDWNLEDALTVMHERQVRWLWSEGDELEVKNVKKRSWHLARVMKVDDDDSAWLHCAVFVYEDRNGGFVLCPEKSYRDKVWRFANTVRVYRGREYGWCTSETTERLRVAKAVWQRAD